MFVFKTITRLRLRRVAGRRDALRDPTRSHRSEFEPATQSLGCLTRARSHSRGEDHANFRLKRTAMRSAKRLQSNYDLRVKV